MAFNSNSRLPQVVPRTPKDVSAADADSVFMSLLEGEQVLKTGLSSAGARVLAYTDGGRKQRQRQNMRFLRSLTFELSGRQRQGARPGLGGLPLALRLSEGLGSAARCAHCSWSSQDPVTPGGRPPVVPAPR